MSEHEALLQENRMLREEIAALRLAVTNTIPTFEGRTAIQWARYARDAEAHEKVARDALHEIQRLADAAVEK